MTDQLYKDTLQELDRVRRVAHKAQLERDMYELCKNCSTFPLDVQAVLAKMEWEDDFNRKPTWRVMVQFEPSEEIHDFWFKLFRMRNNCVVLWYKNSREFEDAYKMFKEREV